MKAIIFFCIMFLDTTPQQPISQSATILVNGKPEKVFPLFGPLKEKLWAAGWNPQVVTPHDDVAEHMVFLTEGRFEGEGKYTWAVTQYAPERWLIEYTVSTNERIWFIRVSCTAADDKTSATITYSYVPLTAEGAKKNGDAMKRMFSENLTDWEKAINYYLATSKQYHG